MSDASSSQVWSPSGWKDGQAFDPMSIAEADAGEASSISAARRFILPGVPNAHSHAFQRAMAGMAEPGDDSFWTWRERMYAFAALIEPDDLYAIASQLYLEMLEAGYTQVCEFQYLHHAPDGSRYDDPAAMSRALLQAAADVGIGITLLPVLYQTGGFDARPLSARQRRFGCATDEYLGMLQGLREHLAANQRLGLCLHSLRAVPESAMREVLFGRETGMPVHIHIAEQIAEVEECQAVRGQRPVAWLLDHAEVDADWSLVHATHLDELEVIRLARSGATVALCPTTEANLGDGLFPLSAYQSAGGTWSIGSDSHISVSPVEELRWLEYGQRLTQRRRNLASRPDRPSTGEALFAAAWSGGRRSCGLSDDFDSAGGDWLVLDHDAPPLVGAKADDVLDRWIFSGNRPLVREVWTQAQPRVISGRHIHR